MATPLSDAPTAIVSVAEPTAAIVTSAISLDDIFAEWIAAGLLPSDRFILDDLEGPARQRRRMAKYETFYSDFHVHPLPLERALAVFESNPRHSLSVPLLRLQPGKSPIHNITEFVSALDNDSGEIDRAQTASPAPVRTPSLDRSASDDDLNVVSEPVIAIEAINADKASALDDTVEADEISEDATEDDSDTDDDSDVSNSAASTTAAANTAPGKDTTESSTLSSTASSPAESRTRGMFGKLFGRMASKSKEASAATSPTGAHSNTTLPAPSPSSPPTSAPAPFSLPKSDPASSKWGLGKLANALSSPINKQSPQRDPRSLSPSEVDAEDDDNVGEYQRFFHLLALGDEFLPKSLFACWRITGLEKHPAVFLLATNHFYIIDNFTLDDEGKLMAISEHESLAGSAQSFQVTLRVRPPSQGAWDEQDPNASIEIPHSADGTLDRSKLDVVLHVSKVKKSSPESEALQALNSFELQRRKEESFAQSLQNHVKIRYTELTAMYRRRYQLRSVGIEMFTTSGHTPLLAFAKNEDREKVYSLLVSQAGAVIKLAQTQQELNAKRITDAIDPRDLQPPRPSLHTDDRSRVRQRAMTERWQNGLISNFDYLIYLNTLAGRSFSDLTQYPVFPWVLSDYRSNKLDLSDTRVYRDLTKPMGAIGEERSKMFVDRYNSWDDTHTGGVGHRYHYATHYSSPASVLYYMIRCQPFTKTALQLQGGRFDHADRLFHDMQATWQSASSTGGLTDVKELIPEFFFFPDMFINSDRFDLGEKQRGGHVDHVRLPPWAHNDPRLFVRLHREALESSYVSEHIHHWIDLIFGYQQRGKFAVKAQNVFHYLTYEGVVDIDKITDPLTRAATIDQMNQFGQTPHQLFKTPHPPRRVKQTKSVEMSIAKHPHLLHKSPLQPNVRAIPSLPNNPGRISALYWLSSSERLIALDGHKALIPNHWSKFISWGHVDSSLRVRSMPVANQKKSGKTADSGILSCLIPHSSAITCALVTDDAKYVVTGSLDMCVNLHTPHPVYEFAVLDQVHSIVGHHSPITALAANSTYKILVTGAANGTVILFDLDRMQIKRQLPMHPSAITAIACHSLSGDFVTCAGNALFVWNVNGDLIAEKSSGSGEADSIDAVAFTQGNTNDYCIVTGGRDSVVRVRTVEKRVREDPVNGSDDKVSVRPDHQSALLTTAATQLNDYVHGWPLLTLSLKATLDAEGSGISCIHCSGSDVSRMWVGDANGKITAFSLSKDEHWQKDEDSTGCALCGQSFTPINRRHHCRKCGQLVCNKCSGRKMPLPDYGHVKPVRVCNQCWIPTTSFMIGANGKLIKNKS